MGETAYFVIQIAWEITSLALVFGAWWRWRTTQHPPDRPFVVGASLASLSCFEMVPFWVAPFGAARFGQLLVYVVSYGALVAVVCTVAALVILPFASLKAKWLAFASSLMTLCFVAMFLYSLSAQWPYYRQYGQNPRAGDAGRSPGTEISELPTIRTYWRESSLVEVETVGSASPISMRARGKEIVFFRTYHRLYGQNTGSESRWTVRRPIFDLPLSASSSCFTNIPA